MKVRLADGRIAFMTEETDRLGDDAMPKGLGLQEIEIVRGYGVGAALISRHG